MMMKSIKIELKLLEDIKSFVQCVNQYDLAINLHAGRAYVNAKSILGIFSLDMKRLFAHTGFVCPKGVILLSKRRR